MADLWGRARSPRWIVQLLDRYDNPRGELLGMRGGEAKIQTFARLGGSATLQLTNVAAQPIDFFTDRVSIAYDPGIAGLDPWPVGVYLFDSPKLSHEIVRRYEAAMLTKMAVIDRDNVIDSYSLDAGELIIPAVHQLILSTGETRVAVTESAAVTSAPIAFEAGTSKLTIINELLTSAGYGSLWCDGFGQFRVEPYVEPRARPVERTFEAGSASIHKPGWTREQDILNVPNRVVVVSPGTDEDPPIIGVAENWDVNSPFSIPNRGVVARPVEEVSDLSSIQAAESYADRLLLGGMSPTATLEAVHAIVPLNPGSRVRFVSDGQRDATVREMNFDLSSFNSQCQAIWSEVTL